MNLPFEDLSSGALVEVDEIPIEKALSETKIKILETIKAIQEKEDEPALRWVKNSEIVEKSGLTKNTISKPLSQLKEQGKLNWEDKKGYQVKDFDDELF